MSHMKTWKAKPTGNLLQLWRLQYWEALPSTGQDDQSWSQKSINWKKITEWGLNPSLWRRLKWTVQSWIWGRATHGMQAEQQIMDIPSTKTPHPKNRSRKGKRNLQSVPQAWRALSDGSLQGWLHNEKKINLSNPRASSTHTDSADNNLRKDFSKCQLLKGVSVHKLCNKNTWHKKLTLRLYADQSLVCVAQRGTWNMVLIKRRIKTDLAPALADSVPPGGQPSGCDTAQHPEKCKFNFLVITITNS